MSNLKSLEGRAFHGAVKMSHVRVSTNVGVKGGHFSEINMNGEVVLFVNLGKKTVFIKACEE